MQQQNSQPIKTFTIGFEDPEFNEAPFAADVANHLKTDHSELLVTAEDAQSLVSDLPRIYDEPFADYSQIPAFFVCKSAKHAVTVSLSGDAGDELFGGYNRYLLAPKLWKKLNKLPKNSAKIRVRNRCEVSGRPHGVYRKLKISRIALRDMASSGKIPGITKSSW